jgi:Flp pilus assembly pilin Flp
MNDKRTHTGQEGQTLAEYGLILALAVVVVVATLMLLGPEVRAMYQNIVNAFPAAP